MALLLLGVAVIGFAQRVRTSSADAASPADERTDDRQRVSTVTFGLRSWPVEHEACTIADGRVTVDAVAGGTAITVSSRGPSQASLQVEVAKRIWRSSSEPGTVDLHVDGDRVVVSGDAVAVDGNDLAPQRVPVHLDVGCAAARGGGT